MKSNIILFGAAGAIALSFASVSSAQLGGPYVLTGSTIGPGHGGSAGGGYELTATIGQRAAGSAIGGSYKLESGFWSTVTPAQTPDAPKLSIRLLADAKVLLAWPLAAQGFRLEYTEDMASGKWQAEATPIIDTESQHTVALPAIGPARCYRLVHE